MYDAKAVEVSVEPVDISSHQGLCCKAPLAGSFDAEARILVVRRYGYHANITATLLKY